MFTNLQHKAIERALLWMFDQVAVVAPGRAQYRRSVAVRRFGDRDVRWGRAYGDEWRTLTFADLLSIVRFDLANVYFTVGNTVLKQTNGAPIGGFLSAFYGNLVCAFAEHQYCMSLGADQRLLAARRCQDDVFGVISYDPTDAASTTTALRIRADFLDNRVYKDGLTVKQVLIENNRAKFVGASVFIGDQSLFCSAFNRNWATLSSGYQAFPRFHHWASYVSNQSKLGVVIGALRRIRRFCTFDTSAILEIYKLFIELRLLDYPDHVMFTALSRLRQGNVRKHVNVPSGIWKCDDYSFWSSVLNYIRAISS